MNKAQCIENYYLQQHLKIVPSHYSLVRCLRDMGHEVTQKVYEESDQGVYDKVIVYLASPGQFVTRFWYEGLEAIHDYPDCVFGIDDWQIDSLISSQTKENLLKKFTLEINDKTETVVKSKITKYERALDVIHDRNNLMLMSVFAGGDVSLLTGNWPIELIKGYNPNPYHLNRIPGDRWDVPRSELNFIEQSSYPSREEDLVLPADKIKMWNFSSLVQSATISWLKKQNVENWEIEYFGSKAKKQRRLAEADMVKVYAEQWGCLMPGYKHAGSGWWRARPLQVADAGSILIGDPKEMEIYYGDSDLASLTARDIEANESELELIAKEQKKHLYNLHPLDKLVQQKELESIL